MIEANNLLKVKAEEALLLKLTQKRFFIAIASLLAHFLLLVDFSLIYVLIHLPVLLGLIILVKDHGHNILNNGTLKCASVSLVYGLIINIMGIGASIYLLSTSGTDATSKLSTQSTGALSAETPAIYNNGLGTLIIVYPIIGFFKLFLALLLLRLNNQVIQLKENLVTHMKSGLTLEAVV